MKTLFFGRYKPIKRRNFKGKIYYKWTFIYSNEFLRFKEENKE